MMMKDVARENRPRERLLEKGPGALSNAELLAIILRVGTKKENVLELSHRILQQFDLPSLSRVSSYEISQIPGIGRVKATQIVSLFELARRLASFQSGKKRKIKNPLDVTKVYKAKLANLKKEHFIALYLDTKNHILKEEIVSIGSLDTTIVHPREVFSIAVKISAASLILVHNHPSGSISPSKEDIAQTKRIKKCGELFGIRLLDHIIIGNNKFYSFASEEMF